MPNNLRDDLIDILEAVSGAQLSTLRRLRRDPQEKPRSEQLSPSKTYVSYRYGI